MSTQYRQKDGSDPRFYSPDRDIAYIGHQMIERALGVLDPEAYPGYLSHLCSTLRVQPSDFIVMTEALIAYMQLMPHPDQAHNAAVAWEKSGLGRLERDNPAPLAMFCTVLGMRILPSIFNALRSVTPLEDPAWEPEVQKLVDTANDAVYCQLLPRWLRISMRYLPSALSNRLLSRWSRHYSERRANLHRTLRLVRNKFDGQEKERSQGSQPTQS